MSFRYEISVTRWNEYGDKVRATIPATIVADNPSALTDKMRAAFGATYNNFRDVWSHTLTIVSVTSEPEPREPQNPETD